MLYNKEIIPSDIELIFVSDLFTKDFIGGAELTHDAILQSCPYSYVRIHSKFLTPEMVEKHKDKKWLLGNISQISKDALILIANLTKYSMIECDYLYCQYRSSHLHKLQTGEECNCHKQNNGRFVHGLHKRAQSVHFMSQGQLDEYKKLFPKMNKWNHLFIQGSTFDFKTLNKLKELRDQKINTKPEWAVLDGGSWIKNQKETENYCKQNKIPYVLLGKMKPQEFLKELAKYKGLVFHPKGYDTNPRLTIEARLLGLELDLNNNVQNKNDDWFQLPIEELDEYLRDLPAKFWREIKL